MKIRFAVVVGVVAWLCAACGGKATGEGARGNGGNGGNGGTAPSDGVGGDATSVGATCADVGACGGSVVGTWSVTSSCLGVTGWLDPRQLGLSCPRAAISGLYDVTGTWSADSSGSYVDATMTTGIEQIEIPAECLSVSGTSVPCSALGPLLSAAREYTADCNATADGSCSCAGVVRQAGSPGQVRVDAALMGAYTASNGALTLDAGATYQYCVAAGAMTWTPRPTSEVIHGTIVFQR